ncbi:MAG: 23S rRNA (guanosine(2251)-2'-O)-methyltransferase RlmB [bacterium]
MTDRSPHPANRPPGRAGASDTLYGLHTVEAALHNPERRILRLLATANAARRLAPVLASSGIAPEIVAPRDLDRLADPGAVHQGVLAEARPLPDLRLDQVGRQATILVLDQVTDPHNVGAILRSAAAFSAGALVTTARHSPQASAVLAKAASGAVEWVPFVKVTNLARALDELKGYGFTVLGLDSEAPLTIEQARPQPPVALVLGAEGKGLRRLTRETCEHLVRLDLPGPIKSLNVSNAAALALYALRTSA